MGVGQVEPDHRSARVESSLARSISASQSRVSVTATDLSWVQVIDANGRIIFKKVLKPGEVYRVPDQQGLTLTTGNAGGINLTVDGKRAPQLGQKGDIVRGVTLDPNALSRQRPSSGRQYNPWMR